MPFCGYQPDVSSFDGRDQRMFHNGVRVTVPNENLEVVSKQRPEISGKDLLLGDRTFILEKPSYFAYGF